MSQTSTVSKFAVFQAMLLVGGTCIGAGMLANPIATGMNGFFPSMTVMLLSWFLMTSTGMMLLEVSLWMKDENAHIITMSSKILGKVGKVAAWVLFFFIAYASIVSYAAGGGRQVAVWLSQLTGQEVSKAVGCSVFTISLGFILFVGRFFLGKINSILFVAMVVAYVLMLGGGVSSIEPEYLAYKKWSKFLYAMPVLVASFHFHSLVPSLIPYLKSDAKSLRIAILGGSTLTLCFYIVWQIFVLGIVPAEGPNSLTEALIKGQTPTIFIAQSVQSSWVGAAAEYFAFFALVTSFLGMSLGLFDFLSDGLSLSRRGGARILLSVITFIPTVFCAVYFERAFYVALETSGGFGDAILNGIMPPMMIWVGRYRMGYENAGGFTGGRFWLIITAVGFALTVALEACSGLF